MDEYYTVRQAFKDKTDVWRVAKWAGGKEPEEVFTVVIPTPPKPATMHPSCSCAGFRHAGESREKKRAHKHIQLVLAFLERGEPPLLALWFDQHGDIVTHQAVPGATLENINYIAEGAVL